MKGFSRVFLFFLTLGTAFILGLQVGREKEKAKIPKFQEEQESDE